MRRTRSLQRQFKAIYPERLEHFREEFKRIQAITGDLRDLDVYLLDFAGAAGRRCRRRCAPTSTRCTTLLETRRARALTATRRGAEGPAHRTTR